MKMAKYFKEIYGEPPMVHGAFIYRCGKCKEEWLMWLENGVEGATKIMPSPFTIICECGGWAEHIDWHKDIKLKRLTPLWGNDRYFALDINCNCGIPSVYMGKGKGDNMSSCEQRKCKFWTGQVCTDEIAYINSTDLEACCRYHPDAVIKESEGERND